MINSVLIRENSPTKRSRLWLIKKLTTMFGLRKRDLKLKKQRELGCKSNQSSMKGMQRKTPSSMEPRTDKRKEKC